MLLHEPYECFTSVDYQLHCCRIKHFCEDDITTAKDVLYANASVPPKHRRIKRQGADKTKNNIDDIYKVLDETDPDALSIFVARDLGKLPSIIDFNHVDK